MQSIRSVAIALAALWGCCCLSNAVADDFTKQVSPLLTKYCAACHGETDVKAELRIGQLNHDLIAGDDADQWEEVLNQLQVGEMPPEDEPQPTPAERETITSWLNGQLRHAAEVKRSTGGQNVMRRLTRYEYNNTMRDLLGIDYDFARDLPPEGTAAEGFKNNSSVLGTSSLHIEYFQRIARSALQKTLVFGDKPKEFDLTVQPETIRAAESSATKKQRKKNGRDLQLSQASVVGDAVLLARAKAGKTPAKRSKNELENGSEIRIHTNDIPLSGPIRVTVRAATTSGIAARLHLELGYNGGNNASPFKVLGSRAVTSQQMQDYIFEARAEDFPLKTPAPSKKQFLRIRNGFNRGTKTMADDQVPGLLVDSVRIQGPFYESWPPKTRTAILGDDSDADKQSNVTELLTRFMRRAYRRPPSASEVSRISNLYRTLRDRNASHEGAIIDTLSAVLASPGFLLIAEPLAPNAAETTEQARELNEFELATRLSYFLWSSQPDQRLMSLAANGKLSDPETLDKEVQRMLADDKCDAFYENFVSQWFDLEGLYSVAVNPEYFPDFVDDTKGTMAAETIAFVRHLVEENRSALELIHSDYAILNADIAKHYGIDGVAGEEFQRVALTADQHRGGILTHGSILTLGSSGDDTHPILRGVWLLERLLNDPPPPPPPAVPTLAQDDKGGERLSLKEKLEAHRQQDACMTCHRKIDPWGVALEHYDGIGRWRPASNGDEPIIATPKPVGPDAVTKNSDTIKSAEQSFPVQPAKPAARLAKRRSATPRELELVAEVNETLEALQRPHNHLRKLGSDGAPDQLRRFVGYIQDRQPKFETAVDKLLKETGQDRAAFLKEFRDANMIVLQSNEAIYRIADQIAPKKPNKLKKRKNRKTTKNVVRRGVVDANTQLADGTKLSGLADLKTYLLTHKQEQFTETVVRKMMSYSLGRYLDFTDTETVKSIHQQFAKDDYRMRGLIKAIVLSKPFRTK